MPSVHNCPRKSDVYSTFRFLVFRVPGNGSSQFTHDVNTLYIISQLHIRKSKYFLHLDDSLTALLFALDSSDTSLFSLIVVTLQGYTLLRDVDIPQKMFTTRSTYKFLNWLTSSANSLAAASLSSLFWCLCGPYWQFIVHKPSGILKGIPWFGTMGICEWSEGAWPSFLLKHLSRLAFELSHPDDWNRKNSACLCWVNCRSY